eukprot:m.83300 g.83300  ORF g.83300 m.83300 type:complete len:165 (-) comp14761_c2_seq9:115-609(-)
MSAPVTRELPAREKFKLLAETSLEDREPFFGLNECPITPETEKLMEEVSGVASEEHLKDEWAAGEYQCARCQRPLYPSTSKFKGPCVWPSFRQPCSGDSLHEIEVTEYNGYECAVREIYCGGCKLFLGHMFEDGAVKGDSHPDAHWRHCVLTLSLEFVSKPTPS